MIPAEPALLITSAEFARLAGISKSTVDKMRHFRRSDAPPCVRIGRSVRYERAAVLRWVAERAEASQ